MENVNNTNDISENAVAFVKEYNELCRKYNLAMSPGIQILPRRDGDELEITRTPVKESLESLESPDVQEDKDESEK